MSQQVLADRVGVTRQTINAIELSKHSPSLELAFLISDVFVMPVEKVFFRPLPTGSDDEDATVIELKRKRAG